MIRNAVVALGAVVLTGSLAVAQWPPAGRAGGGGQQPPPITNLQVIPKDTPRPQVLQTMQAFTQALGVQCNYCHVQEGRGGRNDMASDEKATKKTARQMMLMARELNAKLPSVVGKPADAVASIGCVTCHRGVPIPMTLQATLARAVTQKDMDGAIAEYRELRTKYAGTMAYDLSENGLINMGNLALQNDRPDNALAWLNLNLEFFPKSARTYQAIAQVHQRKNDKEAAIKALEKAVELDPNNAQAKAQLENLKK